MRQSFEQHILATQGVVGITADVIIFTVKDGKLHVLLVRRAHEPYQGRWAIPGGFMDKGETLEETARRELEEETGVRGGFYLEQLFTFSGPARDPRGPVNSTAYFALVNEVSITVRAGDDAKEAAWFPVNEIPRLLAFDHGKILVYALQRLRWKIEYTNVAWSFLPEHFPLAELQSVYEAILGRTLDKRNFRKKILQLGIVVSTQKRLSGQHRPAQLFRFKTRELQVAEVL